MKLAIISDTHLGAELCTLVEKSGDKYIPGPKFQALMDGAGTENTYIILLGDILDFSVASYENAYSAAKTFFTLIKEHNIADQIIYVPGNHDYDIWGVVEYEANIIYQLNNCRLPRKFRMAAPGILDDRKDSEHPGLSLPGVERRTDGHYRYGGLFLDSITRKQNDNKDNGDSHFIFAYPNLYLITEDESFLMTHGQYFEVYWQLLSEFAPEIFKGDLEIGKEVDIREFVSLNFPFNQLACTGVGQAGVLSKAISNLQLQVNKGEVEKAKEYLNNLDDYIDENVFDFHHWYQFLNEMCTDLISNKLKSKLIDLISSQKETRFDKEFWKDPGVIKRVQNYYSACRAEINNLNTNYKASLPYPRVLIAGHTHDPISWNSPDAPKIQISPGTGLKVYNTGGWLWKIDGQSKVLCGAEIFKYESGTGFSSVSIK